MKPRVSNLKDTLRIAQLAAMEAGDYALNHFTRTHVLYEKSITKDVYTSVDKASEKRIVKALQAQFPDDTIFSEERPFPRTLAERVWWVDPLDGSISYVFGLPYWGVSIGLIQHNQPMIGVVYLPTHRELYWAVKGEGAYLNYRRLHVSRRAILSESVIAIDYGYQKEREAGITSVTRKLIDHVKYALTYACTAGSLALVASGKIDGYIHHMARRFDVAAGALFISEAGGMVSDTLGNPIDWRDIEPVHVLASNGSIHAAIRKLVS